MSLLFLKRRACRLSEQHVLPLVGLALLGASACRKAPASEVTQARNDVAQSVVREVKTATADLEAWERTLRAVGNLAAFEQSTLSTKVPGRLEELAIDLGTYVKRGDLVARIESRDYELRVQQAQAFLQQARARLGLPPQGDDDAVDSENTGTVRQARALLAEARANRERVQGLRQQGVTSLSELDVVESAWQVAQSREQDALEEVRNRQALLAQRRAELAIAQAMLDDTRIVAPFDGVTLERRAGLGEYLSAGAQIAVLARVDPLRLRLEIPEHDAVLVHTGQSVRVALEADEHSYAGTIVRTSPAFNANSRMLIVEAELPNSEQQQLRPGAFARAEIVVDSKAQALSVPASAIVSFAGIDKVIAIEDGKTVERRVVVGRRAGERVEILSGLQSGAEVVLAPGNLQSGESVRGAH